MARITWGAQTLIDQVAALGHDASYTTGEPDGLDVIREITFTDKDTADWLAPIMQVQLDGRIAEMWHDENLRFVFQAGVIADGREPYSIGEVDAVLNAPAEVQEPVEPTEPAEPKKATPRRRAPKKAT